jgi:hypothetical protein
MNAFDRALASLHRDGNLSVACTWQRASGDPVAFSGIRSAPVDQAFGQAQIGGVAEQLLIDVPVADVADIARGDIITMAGATHKVETVRRDIEGLTWHLTLAKGIPA